MEEETDQLQDVEQMLNGQINDEQESGVDSVENVEREMAEPMEFNIVDGIMSKLWAELKSCVFCKI